MSQAETNVEQGQQPVPTQEAPQKEHRWLQKLVGEWVYETDRPADPDQPPAKHEGTERVRSLGGLWFLAEGEGQMPGGDPALMLMTLGYDAQRKRFVGTWIGSMMTHLWIYDGELDSADRVLTLNSEGPSMAGDGKMAKYRDVIEFTSENHRTLTAHVLGADGKWQPFMKLNYRRK